MISNNSKSSHQIELLASLYAGSERVINLTPETHKGGGCIATGRPVAPQQSQPTSSLSSNALLEPIKPISGSGSRPDYAAGRERSDQPLGIHAESVSTFGGDCCSEPLQHKTCSHSKTEKITTKKTPIADALDSDSHRKIREIRADRYRLLSAAAEIATREGEKHKSGLRNECALNYHRVCKCRRTPHTAGDDGDVKVYKSKEHGKAFYGGLVMCGNVWVCPVCAAVVQERRRAEIAQGIDWAYGNDKKVVMVTITFSHTRFQSLADLLSKQSRALRKLRGGREWTDFKDSVGFGGLIRTLELTYGKSGWHPHTHELWIVDKDVDPEYIRHTVTERWLKICRKEGLVTRGKTEAFRKHSIDVKDNCSTSDYMAKQDDSSHWGADREIANGSVKGAYGKGKHPFQLLDEYSLGNEYSGKLFLDYLEAMRGKAQIFWSHGLKDRVGLDEKTDVELAEEKQDAADLLTSIKRNEWKLVLKYNARTLVLDAAELYGLPGIHILLNDLYCKEIDVQDSS